MNDLAALVESGKFFAKAVKGFVGGEIHGFPHLDHPALFVAVKANGQVFAHVVHIGVTDIFPGEQLPIQKYRKFPRALPKPQGHTSCAGGEAVFRHLKLIASLPFQRKHSIFIYCGILKGVHPEAECLSGEEVDAHFGRLFPVGAHSQFQGRFFLSVLPDLRQKVKIMGKYRFQIPQLWVVGDFCFLVHCNCSSPVFQG